MNFSTDPAHLPSHVAVAVFWVAFALVVYAYAGYPVLLWLLALVRRRTSQTRAVVDLDLTLLICAHNEAQHIGAKLEECLALNYPKDRLQILVASDGSTDGTDEIVQQFAPRGVELVRIPRQHGKTHAQNVAAKCARGRVIVFSDATARYNADALQYLAGRFSDARVGAVSGAYVYHDPSQLSPTDLGARAYAGYDNRLRDLQGRVSTITGCCGCIYAVRRDLYTELDPRIISDLVQPLHVLRQGYRVAFEPRAVAWETATASVHREFSMRVRVVARAIAGLATVSCLLVPWRHPWVSLQLWSHKLLRWSVPLLMVAMFSASLWLARSPLYRMLFVAQVVFYVDALLALMIPLRGVWKPLTLPLYFCTINTAAVAGMLQYLRGNRYTVWQPDRETAYERA